MFDALALVHYRHLQRFQGFHHALHQIVGLRHRRTLKEFTTMKNRVEAFDKNRGKKTYFEDLDVIWSDEFELFLLNKAENGTKLGYNIGTIEKTYCILITVLNHFYNRRKQLQIGLTDDFRIKSTSSTNGFKRGKKSINY